MAKVQYDIDEIKERLTYYVLNSLHNDPDPSDDKLKQMISDAISEQTPAAGMSLDTKRELAMKIFNSLRRLDAIEPLMQDPQVTEIMVNGPDNIFYEMGGTLHRSDIRFKDTQTLTTIISCFFANQNRPLNEANPIADLRLPDGSRANAVLPPVAPDGPIITIRKFTGIKQDIVSLIRQGFISEEAARFLSECVVNRKTIFLCGGTGSGKTTFLNTLSSFIPADERVVTIEDSAELNLQGIKNLVRMEARLPGPDGSGEVNIATMIRTALRMRPDRIIVGEVRGKESADMLTALNSGHQGSFCTGHGNSCIEMLERLTGMIMAGSGLPFDAIITQVSMGVDLIIHITRNKTGKRYIDEICSVLPAQGKEYRLKQLFVNKGGDELECKVTKEDLCKIAVYRG
ncbi:pilus assembly protein CpaF [Ruminococcaceae bacterium YRB3002]|nr:pilus assembly protein CpaF [Ruminococcaceae bacterium YRB3002]